MYRKRLRLLLIQECGEESLFDSAVLKKTFNCVVTQSSFCPQNEILQDISQYDFIWIDSESNLSGSIDFLHKLCTLQKDSVPPIFFITSQPLEHSGLEYLKLKNITILEAKNLSSESIFNVVDSYQKSTEATSSTKKLKLAIVDDSPEDREIYMRTLSKYYDLECDEFASGPAALKAIKKKDYSLLLLDYQMSNMDGLEVLQKMNETDLKVDGPIIVLTGSGNQRIAVEFMNLGVSDYLVKDLNLSTVLVQKIYKSFGKYKNQRVIEEKQEELGFFAQTLAHDMKSPLRRIATYSRLMYKSNTQNYKKYSKIINEDAMSLVDFLEKLLAYTKTGRSCVAKLPVDLNQIVKMSLEKIENEIRGRNASIIVENLPIVSGENTSLVQLFQNLISNSIKHCILEPKIHIQSEVDEHSVTIFITDNGVGVPEDKVKKVFEPFYKLGGEEKNEGIGLGLALCERIAQQHQATIELAPLKKGRGTQVSLTFPLCIQ